MNGAIHHLNDRLVETISEIIVNNFEKSLFISVDPVIHNNKTINKFMIKFDRGKFIRKIDSYKKILKGFENPATPRSAGGTGLNWQGAVSSDMPDLRG